MRGAMLATAIMCAGGAALVGGSAWATQAASSAAEAEGGRTMDAAYIAVPVVRDGVLVNYLFVSLRFEIAPGVDIWRTRERAHFLRDALVSAAHRTPLADSAHADQLNQPAALAAFRAAAAEALGAQAVRTVSITATYSSHRTSTARR